MENTLYQQFSDQEKTSENITRIFNPAGTPEAKRKRQQEEILDSIFG